jgi:hypothetical protein
MDNEIAEPSTAPEDVTPSRLHAFKMLTLQAFHYA